ncbi:TIGR01212 family radical SAM protein [Bdellovibrionota bacterium FG-2]
MTEHFYPYSRYLQKTFGGKTYKLVLSSGLSCPTRDGSIARGGCRFCDERGSSSHFGAQTIDQTLPALQKRFGAEHFLAYFQSYTNTYASVEKLSELYREALAHPQIKGLCIGTRPDCLPNEVLELLESLAQTAYVSLELGVQSFEDKTLQWLGRGHDSACAFDAFERIHRIAPHVSTCVHLMFGSPTDSAHVWRDAAGHLNRFVGAPVQGVKLHQLMVLEGTAIGAQWKDAPFPTLSLEQYCEGLITLLSHLSPELYVERLYATSSEPDKCLAPKWSTRRWDTHNQIARAFETKGLRQGSR